MNSREGAEKRGVKITDLVPSAGSSLVARFISLFFFAVFSAAPHLQVVADRRRTIPRPPLPLCAVAKSARALPLSLSLIVADD